MGGNHTSAGGTRQWRRIRGERSGENVSRTTIGLYFPGSKDGVLLVGPSTTKKETGEKKKKCRKRLGILSKFPSKTLGERREARLRYGRDEPGKQRECDKWCRGIVV